MAIIKLQGKEELRKRVYYEFESTDTPLGVGGMGKVYKGRCVDERNGYARDVAIKFMYEDLPDHVIERARREASIQVRNDNLVEMLGFVETETKNMLGEVRPHYHVVSELLNGVMLDDLLSGKVTDQWGNTVPFAEQLYRDYNNDPFRFAIFVAKSILSGIMALHDIGFIHRDIDPTNIMVTADGHVKLIDFGIAKPLSSLTTHDKSLTSAGQFMGKAQYAAPELVLGDVRHQNGTTDIYAVGIILFQLMVGHLPFEGATHEVLEMQLHKKMPLHLVKNRRVRDVIDRATRKKQEQRYQSAAEFRVAVEQLAIGGMSSSTNWQSVFRTVAIVAGIGIVGVGGYMGVSALISSLGDKEGGLPSPVVVKERGESDKPVPYEVGNPHSVSGFEQAKLKLAKAETAQNGLEQLERLSDEYKDFNATYLLARLYSDCNTQVDENEVSVYRANCRIDTDVKKAHALNQLSVAQNEDSYKALYELGTDFLAGAVRTGMPNAQSRDLKRAYSYLKKAWELARSCHDDTYAGLIEREILRIPKKYK